VDNKQLLLFPNCIKSLASSLTLGVDVELVISDWQSDDWKISEWILDAIPYIPIHIITIVGEGFSAGRGRNIAAKHAKGDILFFMDADMIVNREVINHGILKVSDGYVYYPTVLYETDGGKQIIHEGGGNVFMSADMYRESGGWPEFYKHGFEDTDYASTLKKISKIHTNENISIFHQWHPQTTEFKNLYAKEDPQVDLRKQHYQSIQNKQSENIITAIDFILNTDPNTTHHNLNKPIRANNRSFI